MIKKCGQKWNIGSDAIYQIAIKCMLHGVDRALAIRPPGNQFRNHGVIVDRDLTTFTDAAVNANGIAVVWFFVCD